MVLCPWLRQEITHFYHISPISPNRLNSVAQVNKTTIQRRRTPGLLQPHLTIMPGPVPRVAYNIMSPRWLMAINGKQYIIGTTYIAGSMHWECKFLKFDDQGGWPLHLSCLSRKNNIPAIIIRRALIISMLRANSFINNDRSIDRFGGDKTERISIPAE